MTPEQLRAIQDLVDDVTSAALDCANPEVYGEHKSECAAISSAAHKALTDELSDYVRIPPPRPQAERRCGQCVHMPVCMDNDPANDPEIYPGILADQCPHYSEPGALPEGVAAVVRAANQLLDDNPLEFAEDMRALHEAQRALSDAELAMVGVEGKERGNG